MNTNVCNFSSILPISSLILTSRKWLPLKVFSPPVIMTMQRAKKLLPDSPGLVDFAFGLANSVPKVIP